LDLENFRLTVTYLVFPFREMDIIGAMMIVWRVRRKIIRSVLRSIVCNIIVHSAMHTHEHS